MIKKSLIILFFCLSLVGLTSAETMKISVWGGYTTLSMGKVNDSLRNDVKNYSNTSVTKINNGIIGGVDVDVYKINENITVGPRIAYISAPQGKSSGQESSTSTSYTGLGSNITINGVHYNYLTKNVKTNVTTYKNDETVSLMPILVGGKYEKKFGKKISLNGSLYAGIGIATIASNNDDETITRDVASGPFMTTSESYAVTDSHSSSSSKSKSGFMTDLGLNAEYSFTEKISLGLGFGYRMADIDDIDFSGMTATFGFNYKI